MKIFDLFTFFNELDILEIRLSELYGVVDKFIFVEAKKTHSNLDKPLYFEQNKERFSKFLDKIIYIPLDSFPNSNSWFMENYQRNFISTKIDIIQDNDIVLLSDLDEIPSAKALSSLKPDMLPLCFEQINSYVYLNRVMKNSKDRIWMGTSAILKKDISTLQNVRNAKDRFKRLPNAGWHFSYCGGIDSICTKVKGFCHTEYNHVADDKEVLKERILNHKDILGRNGGETMKIEIDNTFPEHIVNNLDKFKHLIE